MIAGDSLSLARRGDARGSLVRILLMAATLAGCVGGTPRPIPLTSTLFAASHKQSVPLSDEDLAGDLVEERVETCAAEGREDCLTKLGFGPPITRFQRTQDLIVYIVLYCNTIPIGSYDAVFTIRRPDGATDTIRSPERVVGSPSQQEAFTFYLSIGRSKAEWDLGLYEVDATLNGRHMGTVTLEVVDAEQPDPTI